MSESAWPRLRPATNGDAGQIKDLVYTVLQEYGLRPDPDDTDADLEDIEQSYLARGGAFCVLETENGSIIGAYGLCPMAEGSCELRKMYLSREHRGKGLGRRLLDDALTKARRLGLKTFAYYVCTSLLAILVGQVLVNLIRPGDGAA